MDEPPLVTRDPDVVVPFPGVARHDRQPAQMDSVPLSTPRRGERVCPPRREKYCRAQKPPVVSFAETFPRFSLFLPEFAETCQKLTASGAVKEGWVVHG